MLRNIRALDGVRGLAIVAVMIHHCEPLIPSNNTALMYGKAAFSYGWVGVDLFFVLSGFLITGILLDTRDTANYFSAFYVRRILRIFPLYYAVLIVFFVTSSVFRASPPWMPLPADRKLYFLYLTNWLALWKGNWGPNVLGHFWSLAVEEQFYLLWPICIWRLSRPRLIVLAIAGFLLALLLRILYVAHFGPSQAIVVATVTRMDSLLSGALVAIVFRDQRALARVSRWLPQIFMGLMTVFIGIICLFKGHYSSRFYFLETFGYSLLAVGFSSLVLYSAAMDGTASLSQRTLQWQVLTNCGKYSYGMYVYHVPVLFICQMLIYEKIPMKIKSSLCFSLLYIGFLIVTSFGIAKLSYEHFERHVLALKRHFEPRRITSMNEGDVSGYH